MGVRTVRLDDEMEKALQEVMAATGLSASAILKRGIETLRGQLDVRTVKEPAVAYETRPPQQTNTAFAIYEKLDLGPGGYSRAPSTDVRKGVRDAIKEKLGR